MQLYENFSSKYRKYKDLEDKLTDMRKNFAQKDRKMRYDPTFFMKNPYLESKFSLNKEESTERIRKIQEGNLNNLNNLNNINNIHEENKNISSEENRKKTKISVINISNSHDVNPNIASLTNNPDHTNKNFSTLDEYRVHQQDVNSFFNFELEEFKLNSDHQTPKETQQKQTDNNQIIDIYSYNNSSSNSNSENSENLVNLNPVFEDNQNKGNKIILFEEMNSNDCNAPQLNYLNENNNLINTQGDFLENTNNINNSDKSKISYPSLKSILDQYNIEARNSYAIRNDCQQNHFHLEKRDDSNNCLVPFDYFDDRPEEKQTNRDTQFLQQSRPNLDDLFNEDQRFYNCEIVSKVSSATVDPFADFY